jgi:hypothetical protein
MKAAKPTAPVTAPAGGCVRLACCVPFCRRTFKQDRAGTPWNEGAEVMCGKHFRILPAELRARKRKVRKLWRKANALAPETPHREKMIDVIGRWEWDLWQLGKLQATEKAAGIA